jgi:hypothetical protein
MTSSTQPLDLGGYADPWEDEGLPMSFTSKRRDSHVKQSQANKLMQILSPRGSSGGPGGGGSVFGRKMSSKPDMDDTGLIRKPSGSRHVGRRAKGATPGGTADSDKPASPTSK